MAFDTTYKKNTYKKPLLIFVELNYHFRTIVFAVALLYDEKEETYIWELQEFLECMNNKPPKVVVTNEDLAMANPIQSVMPSVVHRSCAWHLQNNVSINAPHPSFKKKFNEFLYQYCTEEEFEATWTSMISYFNFEDKHWVSQTYNNRKSWVECFLRGSFFGGLRTTQRSESISSYLSHFLTSKLKLRDLVGQVDKEIQGIRYTEWEDEFISNHTSPLFPSNVLHQYYQQASSVLTGNTYEKVATQIMSALAYSIDSIENKYIDEPISLSDSDSDISDPEMYMGRNTFQNVALSILLNLQTDVEEIKNKGCCYCHQAEEEVYPSPPHRKSKKESKSRRTVRFATL
ncbi:protein FAR-RED IMPAIRED RESPONSE 1-like [Humulus lupulus]|uniref:protein FAR-RED IMPAIRED RESPONSE 1-like n=1 Tax=Humulus lupulus TaxID=3486 RepID=UPI002B409FF8|nr:protein FAR-RED IMPAIRED RESPONSE 1-like [Humulus lupulus]